ncbi:MAG: hypothetical protein ACERKN_15235 [Velocimicrobium sp.]
MTELVKFIAVDNKSEIADNEQYLDKIYKYLTDNGYISNLLIPPSQKILGSVYSITEINEESTVFQMNFNYTTNQESSNWSIFFRFGTYEVSKQLEITIYSDSYDISVDNEYLEQLKLAIKNSIVSDWKDIVWLLDKDSELLSISLYPAIYKTENLLRQLINELMTKVYGIDWWDLFIPSVIKEKHASRKVGYKSICQGFQNIDEHLMSIDVGDLFKIITLKQQKWNPSYEEKLNNIINGNIRVKNAESILEILKTQLVVESDLWALQFSKYLADDFITHFKEFELNRNHIAHNKLIDRSAYKVISKSIYNVKTDVFEALKELSITLLSKEEHAAFERQFKEEIQFYEEIEHERMESEADISIRTNNEIIELYDEALSNFMTSLQENLRFREDLEFSDIKLLSEKLEGTLFTVSSKVTLDTLKFTYLLDLDNSPGTETNLIITSTHNTESFSQKIKYVNGEAYYNFDQGYYMPETEDYLSNHDLDFLLDSIVKYINNELTNLKEQVDSAKYSIIKDGGTFPIAEAVPCSECGEDWICIDDSYAQYGTCLNCGYTNDIKVCLRCECYFNPDFDGETNEDDINFCQNCLDDLDNE